MEQFREFVCRDPVSKEQEVSSEELLMRVLLIRMKQGFSVGWFDKSGIWQIAAFPDKDTAADFCSEKGIKLLTYGIYGDRYYTTPGVIDGVRVNMTYMSSAIRSLKEGHAVGDLAERYNLLMDTGGDYRRFYKLCRMEFSNPYDGYDIEPSKESKETVVKVNTPSIERYTGNFDRNTFDLVRIRLGLSAFLNKQEQSSFAKAHLKELESIAKARIQESKRYQKFGVPPEFLKLDKACITNQGEVELVFVLPDII